MPGPPRPDSPRPPLLLPLSAPRLQALQPAAVLRAQQGGRQEISLEGRAVGPGKERTRPVISPSLSITLTCSAPRAAVKERSSGWCSVWTSGLSHWQQSRRVSAPPPRNLNQTNSATNSPVLSYGRLGTGPRYLMSGLSTIYHVLAL